MIKITLKRLLLDSEMTLKELSNRTGINYNALSRISTNSLNQIPIEHMNKICETLVCQPSDFIIYVKD